MVKLGDLLQTIVKIHMPYNYDIGFICDDCRIIRADNLDRPDFIPSIKLVRSEGWWIGIRNAKYTTLCPSCRKNKEKQNVIRV